MKIEINIEKDEVYRAYWSPHNINFTKLRRDIDATLDRAERFINNGCTTATVKIEHYGDEVGTIVVSTELSWSSSCRIRRRLSRRCSTAAYSKAE
jgi:hypothetical protein